MKFHFLMSLALLLLAFDSGAVLLHPEAFPALQSSAYAATAAEAPSLAAGAGQAMAPAAETAAQLLPEPLSLGMLGVGFAVLGWTRRRGSQPGGLMQALRRHLFPWPALCWLD